jgi:hypothetical protein
MKKSVVIGLWLVFSSVGVLLCTCSSSKTSQPPARCSSITPCETDFICIEGFCRKSCSEEIKCSDGMTCSAQNYCIKPCQKKEDCVDYEQCLDGICELVCIDNDGDGYGNFCARGDDCENNEKDNDPTINPGQGEIAGDGIDNNCNGMTDEAEWEQYPICDDEHISGTARIAPNLMLVLDRSKSMDEDIQTNMTKLAALQGAVASLLEVNKTETVIRFGLSVFSHSGNCTPGEVDYPPGDDATKIGTTVVGLTSIVSTPTGETLENIYNNRLGIFSSDRGKYILLVTDGVPDCPDHNGKPYTDQEMLTIAGLTDYSSYPDFNRTLQAVISLKLAGINTFVIGLGSSTNYIPSFLNRLATEGGTAQSGDPKYYPAGSASTLLDVFNQIGKSVLSCTIEAKVDPGTDPTLYVDRMWLIYYDKANAIHQLPKVTDCATQDGYFYSGTGIKFDICGSYCDQITDGTINNIRVIMGCAPPL